MPDRTTDEAIRKEAEALKSHLVGVGPVRRSHVGRLTVSTKGDWVIAIRPQSAERSSLAKRGNTMRLLLKRLKRGDTSAK